MNGPRGQSTSACRPWPAVGGAPLPACLRVRERAVLARVVDDLGTGVGGGSLLTLAGGGGAGQESLVGFAVERARALGHRVLHSRAPRRETGLPGAAAPRVPLFPDSGTPGAGGEMTRLLRSTRSRPLLLAVEEAQWLDPRSLRELQALLRRSTPARIAVVCAGTVGTGPGDGTGWLGAVGSAFGPPAHHLRLAPLPHEEIAGLVALLCGPADDTFTDEAARVSGGHPAVLHDLLLRLAAPGLPPDAERARALREIGRAVLGDHLLAAVRGHGAGTRSLVAALAVCGQHLDLAAVRSVATGDGTETGPATRCLAELPGVRRLPGGRFTVDPGIRDRLLEELGENERAGLFARAARHAHVAGAGDRAVADLLLAARPDRADAEGPWADRTLRRAARDAARHDDHGRAARLLDRLAEREADPGRRAALEVESAAALLVTRPETGDARIARIVRTPGIPAAVRLRAADLGITGGGALGRALTDALGEAGDGGSETLLALLWAADPTGRREGIGLPPLPELPDRPSPRTQAAVRAWQLALRGEEMERSVELARTALGDGTAAEDGTGHAGANRTRGPGESVQLVLAACRALSLTDVPEEAEAAIDRQLGLLHAAPLRLARPHLLALRGEINLRRGRLAQAERDLEAAASAVAATSRSRVLTPYLHGLRAFVDLEAGRGRRAREWATAPLPTVARCGEHQPWLLFARGAIALADGRLRQAVDELHECGRLLESRGHLNPALIPWRSVAAFALRALGREAEAREAIECERARARRWGAGSALAWAEFAAVQEETEPAPPAGGGAHRLDRVGSAMAHARSGPTGPQYTRVLAELAGLQLGAAAGDPRAAASLEELTTLTAAYPAAPMADRARVLAGAATGAESVPGWDALSAAEQQAALLVGRGDTNREIAALLEISIRAVELRLTRAYRKLSVSGRLELRALVAPRTRKDSELDAGPAGRRTGRDPGGVG
ncbi:LuxR C-terminal-related transcriptional regulator [Streptomyces otsuchiensis]|uniref:LuxR C-terminal-related transcriptional regulator n=1 Tax=Streptomyces otsuchiensis TaxID=2681388 RepID=UPI00103030FB|nr:helix-turn-helix transcriptional regulator [Streptomyces otsuchiensis]